MLWKLVQFEEPLAARCACNALVEVSVSIFCMSVPMRLVWILHGWANGPCLVVVAFFGWLDICCQILPTKQVLPPPNFSHKIVF
jgi:hypothetical protein